MKNKTKKIDTNITGFIEGIVLTTTGFFYYLKTTKDKKQLIKLKQLINKRIKEIEKNEK